MSRPMRGRAQNAGPDPARSTVKRHQTVESIPTPMPVEPRNEALPKAPVTPRPKKAEGPEIPAFVPAAKVTDRDMGLKQVSDRSLKTDNLFNKYYRQAFVGREAKGTTINVFVAEARQLEGAVMADVKEKFGLLEKRDGTGSKLSRADINIKASAQSGVALQDDVTSFGKSSAAFLHAYRDAIADQRRQILSGVGTPEQAVVAAQLRVQDSNLRYVDPGTGAFRSAHALRLPDGSTKGFHLGEDGSLQIVVANGAEKTFLSPAAAGIPALEGHKGVIRTAVAKELQAAGVEIITRPVMDRDLLKGTGLGEHDGVRQVMAEALSDALQKVLDSDELKEALEAPPLTGAKELLRQQDQENAALLVALARLDRSLQADLDAAKAGRWVDPSAQVNLSLRATVAAAAANPKMVEKVEGIFKEIASAPYSRPDSDDHQGQILHSMSEDYRKAQAKNAKFDVFESMGKAFSRAIDRADSRAEKGVQEYGADFALITNRSARLTGALADVRDVASRLGMDPKACAEMGVDGGLFEQKLDLEVSVDGEGRFGRQFGTTTRALRILTNGEIAGDQRENDHPLYPAAGKVLDGVGGVGLFKRPEGQSNVDWQMVTLADAMLFETGIAGLLEANACSPEVIANARRTAQLAVSDFMSGVTGRVMDDPNSAAAYKRVNDAASRLELGKLLTKEDLDRSVLMAANPVTKVLLGRAQTFPVGAAYGGWKAQMRAPGYTIRIGKVNAEYELSLKGVPSGVPDVPNYISNPSNYKRLVQVREDGRPSGTYMSLVGEPTDTGGMKWAVDGILKRPKSEVPTAVVNGGHTRIEIMHKAVELPNGMRVKDLAVGLEDPALTMAVSKHFRDVPLRESQFLSHGFIQCEPNSPLGMLGVSVPVGAVRPMDLGAGRGYIIPVRQGKPQAVVDLVELMPRRNAFNPGKAPKRFHFASKEDLQKEFDLRFSIAVRDKEIAEGSEAWATLDQAKTRVVEHLAHFTEPEAGRQGMLALMSATGAFQPSHILVSPMKGKAAHSDEEHRTNCQRAYANITGLYAATGAHLDAFVTKAG